MARRDAIVAAARGCLGARFRPQGRDPRFGLDCVGVAGIAFGRPAPQGYALRGGSADAIGALIEAAGLVRTDAQRAGDLLLIEAGPAQFHLAILTERGFVHADARLRRVVETPGRPAGRVIAAWMEED